MEPVEKRCRSIMKDSAARAVYDVAFEGLIRECGAPLPGDRIGCHEAGIRDIYADYTVYGCVKGQRLKEEVAGSNRVREKYI